MKNDYQHKRMTNELIPRIRISTSNQFKLASRKRSKITRMLRLAQGATLIIERIRKKLERRQVFLNSHITNGPATDTVSPYLMTEYCWNYWKPLGSKNFTAYMKTIQANMFFKNQDFRENSKYFYESILSAKDIRLIYQGDRFSKQKPTGYVFFDSYLFFNAGHIAVVEETMDILNTIDQGIKIVLLIDFRMILFPELSELIIKKYSNAVLFDCSKFPLQMPINEEGLKKNQISSDAITMNFGLEKHKYFRARNWSIFNPMFSWIERPKVSKFYTAWGGKYTKDTSRQIALEKYVEVRRKDIWTKYVVIHSRSEQFLGDKNIRNSLPVSKRSNLIHEINNLGFLVVATGGQDHDGYLGDKHDGLLYIDELGEIPDSMQIHVVNGASIVLGTASGMTHLTYCTNTPTLYFDVPFLELPNIPDCEHLVLPKRLFKNNNVYQGISPYYRVDPHYNYLENINGQEFSPLMILGYTLKCNQDVQIAHAFRELMEKLGYLESIKDPKSELIKQKLAEQSDKEKAYLFFKNFSQRSRFTPFGIGRIAKAAWKDI